MKKAPKLCRDPALEFWDSWNLVSDGRGAGVLPWRYPLNIAKKAKSVFEAQTLFFNNCMPCSASVPARFSARAGHTRLAVRRACRRARHSRVRCYECAFTFLETPHVYGHSLALFESSFRERLGRKPHWRLPGTLHGAQTQGVGTLACPSGALRDLPRANYFVRT